MTILLSALLSFLQAGAAKAADEGLASTTWKQLDTTNRCQLIRSVLDVRKPDMPGYSLSESSYVKKMATSGGRKIVSVVVMSDLDQSRSIDHFLPEGGAEPCGWTDVAFPSELSTKEKAKLWKINIALYATGNDAQPFAFWMQLSPVRPAAKGRGEISGCPPEYGFATLSKGSWVARTDTSARKFVPRPRQPPAAAPQVPEK
jgi:hypothetical protein